MIEVVKRFLNAFSSLRGTYVFHLVHQLCRYGIFRYATCFRRRRRILLRTSEEAGFALLHSIYDFYFHLLISGSRPHPSAPTTLGGRVRARTEHYVFSVARYEADGEL
jgi:hypothetical protein